MKPNMGQVEKWLRIALGVILLALTVVNAQQWAMWLNVVIAVTGVALIAEGLLRWCPVRAALGLGKQYNAS